jgi:hypothetical protein
MRGFIGNWMRKSAPRWMLSGNQTAGLLHFLY